MSTAKVTSTEPVPGYDALKTRELVSSLSSRSQVELERIDEYERAHQGRTAVFDKLRWLRQAEPIKGYDALDSVGAIKALHTADPTVLKAVRGYERKFANRREVLEEVDRLHRERRKPLVSRDTGR